MYVLSFAPKTRRRAIAALAAVVCFGVGQLAESLHLAFEEHTVCEHGALVHTGHGDDHGATDVDALGASPLVEASDDSTDGDGDGPPADKQRIASRGDNDAHAHCDDVTPPVSEATAFSPMLPVPQLTLRAALQEGQALPQSAPSCALFMTAPKASPPA